MSKDVKKYSPPVRYVPFSLSKKDKEKQVRMLKTSRRLYKKGNYYTRGKVKSFRNKTSKHVLDARRIYGIERVVPGVELSKKTGCSVDALDKIVNKGEGAYYSSGSRPNQTAQSWGIARLASSITSGKSAAVDYDILDNGCDHNKKAFQLAKLSRKKYGFGHSKTKHLRV
jgi:hypothetical protein